MASPAAVADQAWAQVQERVQELEQELVQQQAAKLEQA